MFSWILALVLALALWGLAAAYLWLVKRKRTENHHGLAALAGLRWREFSQIVRQAMAEQRNLLPLTDSEDADRGTSSDFLLQQHEQRWLVSCKHGRAYRFGVNAVNELASAMGLTGAVGGLLITEGHVDRDGLNEAQKHAIEVFDERNLWPLLKPYVSNDMRQTVTGIAQREAARQTGIAGLAALTIGLLAGMGYLTMQTEDASSNGVSAPQATAVVSTAVVSTEKQNSADAPPVPAEAGKAAAATPVDAGTQIADPDPATLLRYQQSVSKALSRMPGVVSGIWVTRSTLSVERSGDDAEVWPLICQELERYPALRTARVQLNPRPGVEEAVRWRQCRTY